MSDQPVTPVPPFGPPYYEKYAVHVATVERSYSFERGHATEPRS
ncbi:hypothetical protein ACWFRJ_35595 [Streptomyces sp. NPDC055239]